MFKLFLICILLVCYVSAAPTEIQENEENSVENAVDTDNAATTMINETPESSSTELTTKAPINIEISTVESSVPTTTKQRRVITFDQRQEGGSNVRVDLENFVIVIMSSPQKPSSPASSLLDLLSRNALKKVQSTKKLIDEDKLQSASSPEVLVLDIGTPEHTQTQAQRTEEFIEGRTPYRVDISARENYNPTSRVSFTPTSNRIVFPNSSSGNYYDGRISKSLRDQVDTNIALITNFGDGGDIADDDNFVNEEQEFIDLPFDRLNYSTDVDMMKLQLQGDNGDDWELKLIGANEECGPERRRNSYGICQFVHQL